MKVYFGRSFWDPRENGPLGIPQKVDWRFSYDNQQYQIPMIYLFPEGVTIDIICLLDVERMNSFREKYENHINSINEEEYFYLEAARSIPKLPLRKIYINDKLTEMRESCSACFIAGTDSTDEVDALREMQEEYDFLRGEDISFQCIRVHVNFLEEEQREVHILKFITSKTEVLLPVKKHFMIEVGVLEKEYIVEFVHPINGARHDVYINEVREFNARDLLPQYSPNNPSHYVRVSYEIAPLLSQDERLLIREIRQPDEVVSAEGDKTVIGRAYGVIGITGKGDAELGKHGFPLETIFTSMYWKSLRNVEMSIAGIYKEKCPEGEIIVYEP